MHPWASEPRGQTFAGRSLCYYPSKYHLRSMLAQDLQSSIVLVGIVAIFRSVGWGGWLTGSSVELKYMCPQYFYSPCTMTAMILL